jgi:predicted DNA binding protein
LRIGTRAENIHDRKIDGTHNKKGSKHPQSKLTEEQVEIIRTSTKLGIELAKEFNISSSTISMIKSGKRRMVVSNP